MTVSASAQPVVMAFEPEGIEVPLSAILPVKQLPASIKTSRKYVQISASIAEVGIIEPPVVARGADGSGVFLLVDGYIRIEILKDLGASSVTCLVAIDDEAFTYNKRVNRLATIQEHYMIRRAIDRGAVRRAPADAVRPPLAPRLCAVAGGALHLVDVLRDGHPGRALRLAAAADVPRRDRGLPRPARPDPLPTR